MKAGWIALALVAAFASNAAAVEVTASLIAAGPATTFGAKKLTASILRKAGVSVTWRDSAACLNIELAGNTRIDRMPSALGVSYPYDGCSRRITIFLDRIRALAGGRADRQEVLLAYVLAHEITHVLQGLARHSEAGIMKAFWTAADYEEIFSGRLGFLDEDVRLIQAAAAQRPVRIRNLFPSGVTTNAFLPNVFG